jgi:hypothetical protein
MQLVDALTNSGDPDAERHLGRGFRNHVKDADAVVLNFDRYGRGVAFDTHARGVRSSMTMNIGERFLDDAEDRELEFIFETAKILADANLYGNSTALGEKFSVRSERNGEARLLQHGRVQIRRNEAHFANRRAGEVRGGAQEPVNAIVPARNGAADLSQGHLQGGQGLGGGFVEFAAHAALLFAANGQ